MNNLDTLRRRRFLATGTGLACSAAVGLGAAPAAIAQAKWPDRRVTIVVGFPAGGATDISARVYAERLQARWGQPVVVENRPGASSGIANAYIRRQPPDGYTLHFVASPFTVLPYVNPKVNNYQPLTDYTVIAHISDMVSVAAAPVSAPFNNLAEMIAWAKRNPGKLNVATSGLGSSDHLSQALLAKRAGIDVTFVHFAGDAPAWQALAQDTVQFRIATYISAKALVESGKIKLLGTATSERTPVLPTLAAIAEAVPGFAHVPYQAVVGPPGMSADLVQTINRDFNAVGKMPEVNNRLAGLGLTVINDRSPAQLAEYLQNAIRATMAAVEASGIKPE